MIEQRYVPWAVIPAIFMFASCLSDDLPEAPETKSAQAQLGLPQCTMAGTVITGPNLNVAPQVRAWLDAGRCAPDSSMDGDGVCNFAAGYETVKPQNPQASQGERIPRRIDRLAVLYDQNGKELGRIRAEDEPMPTLTDQQFFCVFDCVPENVAAQFSTLRITSETAKGAAAGQWVPPGYCATAQRAALATGSDCAIPNIKGTPWWSSFDDVLTGGTLVEVRRTDRAEEYGCSDDERTAYPGCARAKHTWKDVDYRLSAADTARCAAFLADHADDAQQRCEQGKAGRQLQLQFEVRAGGVCADLEGPVPEPVSEQRE
jgi:hypothetical protein